MSLLASLLTPSLLSTTTATTGIQCLLGLVLVTPTGLIGATNGFIIPLFGALAGTVVPITQVVGPAGGAVSLNQVNGQVAWVCGQFVTGPGGLGFQLNVSTVLR